MEVNGKSQEMENNGIMQQMELISNHAERSNEIRLKIQSDFDSFNVLYSECSKYTQRVQNAKSQRMNTSVLPNIECKLIQEKELHEEQLKAKSLSLNNSICVYINKLNELTNLISPVQNYIIDNSLIQWKRQQQLAGNGYKYMKDIDVIQTWCEKLCDLIWITRSQIKEADRFRVNLSRYFELPQSCEIITTLLNMTTQYLSSLVTSTFVITTQPPQVLKTNTRFLAEVRLLIGGKLNIHKTSPVVKVSIVNEAQVNQIIRRNKPYGESCGELLNCTGKMEYHPVRRHFSTNFRSMQLKKIKRTEKKGTDSVMDEKFSILFSSTFFIGNELQFEVWNLSLPVVVIVHGNQDPHAWATVIWDNAFAKLGRVPFNVPDKVPWRNVAETINMKFSAATGRSLSEDSLIFLAEKAFRMQNVDFNHMFISWSQFCKEPLPQRSFTFWEWFYSVMKLTKEHLKGLWTDGAIMGFIRKSEAEEMLTRYATGTFLLRFSDSELGGLTVAWTASKDLSIRNLADRLFDLPYLTKLYPNIDKDLAFGKYYTQSSNNSTPVTNNGYVKPLLVTHVPGWSGPSTNGQGMNSYPNTPQSQMFHENSVGNYSGTDASVYSEPDNNMTAFGNYSLEMDFSSSLNDVSQLDGVFF
ncbi:signal transducer and activator of transcription 5B-like isoform X3 [Rhopalosiphum maidis]|uniref:signal transducer and activator of transcription 5B-like isoform X3 n=1 Tax=Rhopalosiphum maidis TaxID=43146 RepID=UPI000F0022BF|nr:signal transducer and activator of transcription 5B-like isoform X3 [Rhopalosiphum maidis]